MWLPWDESRLLACYYASIGEIGDEHGRVYRLGDLMRVLRHFRRWGLCVSEYGDPGRRSESATWSRRRYTRYLNGRCRVEKANTLLVARKLITLQPHQSERDVVVVGLTLEGYDLGRRYVSFWARSGLRFQEYRNHWVWLLLATLGGACVTKIIDALTVLVFHHR